MQAQIIQAETTQPQVTQLLVSVKNLAEAKIALAADVDIIDLKNPADGALGALRDEDIAQIVQFVAGRKPVSATIGNLAMQPELLLEKIQQTQHLNVDIIKIGFHQHTATRDCIAAIGQAQFKTKLVAVLFADELPDTDLIAHLSAANFYGVMLDTQTKGLQALFDYMTKNDIQHFVKLAQAASLLVGLAGKLTKDTINLALNLKPSFIGVRSAVCASEQRQYSIISENIHILKNMLRENNMAQI